MDIRNKKNNNSESVNVPERGENKNGWIYCPENDLIKIFDLNINNSLIGNIIEQSRFKN